MTAPTFTLERQTAGAKSLAADIRARFGDDDDLLADAIEGQTDAMEAVSRLLVWLNERGADVEALKTLEADYAARRRRYEEQVKSARAALATFMDATNLRKIERPEGTLSLRDAGPSVTYSADFDPERLPEELRRWKCEADRPAVKAALEAGQTLPGAVLTNGGTTLAVRVK